MPTQTPLTDQINALTTYANTVTGASDTCLSDAVDSLVEGYGGGGGISLDGFASGAEPNGNVTLTNTGFRGYAFYQCNNLTGLHIKNATGGASRMCNGCANLEYVVWPSLVGLSSAMTNAFQNCTKLAVFDMGNSADTQSGQTQGNTWSGCTVLKTMIIRSGVVKTLSNVGAFSNTPFASGGTGGTLYVPSALVSSYQSANNWSTILGYANNQIKSIESTHTDPDAPIDLTLYYADGTPIE